MVKKKQQQQGNLQRTDDQEQKRQKLQCKNIKLRIRVVCDSEGNIKQRLLFFFNSILSNGKQKRWKTPRFCTSTDQKDEFPESYPG